VKYLQIIATLAGIASAGVAVATYFTKAGGGGRHRDPPASSASGPPHNAPAAGSGSAEAPRGAGRQGGGDGKR
jgi:hypothetical protein